MTDEIIKDHIPSDPKFLTYPFESSRFVQYAATSLERNHKHELLCEADVGVDVDLIDPDVFKADNSASLHPDDERLLEDDDPAALNARKSRHQRSVSWLRKTEYLSTELYNKYNKAEKVETKLGHNTKRRFTEDIVYRDRESQIHAIEETFEAVRKPIKKHYSKPGVTAVEVLPVLPDFNLWRYPCAQVIFDDDPARKNQSTSDQKEEVNQAMIRGMVDKTGDHFVAYFLPTDETRQLRRQDAQNQTAFTEGASYEYELAREYNWNVKNKTMANYEENYFFVFRNDGVYYNELETRVRLSKRRKLQQQLPGFGGERMQPHSQTKTRLIVQHRDFTDDELNAQAARLQMLEHDSETEGEEEEEEEEEGDARTREVNSAYNDDEEEEEEEETADGRRRDNAGGQRDSPDDSAAESSVSSSEDERPRRQVPPAKSPSASEGESEASPRVAHRSEEEEEERTDDDGGEQEEEEEPASRPQRRAASRQSHSRSTRHDSGDEDDDGSSDLSDRHPTRPPPRKPSSSRPAPRSKPVDSDSDSEDNYASDITPPPRNTTRQAPPSAQKPSRFLAQADEDSDELSSLSD
nr:unnamed protein product [Spirometra erinaceieuropaei]